MENSKIDIQVLLELVLNQRIEGEIESALPKVLNLYLRKLNCLGTAVFQDGNISFIAPKAFQKNQSIQSYLHDFYADFSKKPEKSYYKKVNAYHFYGFQLSDFGYLILLRKNQLTEELIEELTKVTYQLGRDLCQNKEEQRLKLLQQLFDKSSDAILVIDDAGQLSYINEIASKRLSIQKEYIREYEFSHFEQIFKDLPKRPWEQHLNYIKEKESIVLTGQSFDQESGKVIPVEVTASVINVKGKDFVIAISRDVSERKKQEKKLKDTTEKLESVFNEMSDVLWSMSVPDYKMLFVTPSVFSVFETSVEQCMKEDKWWLNVIHPKDISVVDTIFDNLKRDGHFNLKYRIITPSGEEKMVRTRGKLIYDENEKPIRLDIVAMDRTPQYLAQENLNQELRLQEALIDIASTYINLDTKDVVNTINSSLEKMGLFVSADRAYIFDYDFESATTSNTYEWCNDGVPAQIDNLQNVPIKFIPQWLESHRKNEAFYVPDVFSLEDDGEGGLRSILEPQGIKSLIAIPMLNGDELVGFVGFDSVNEHHEYTVKEQRLLFLFGQMLINIRNRQRAENQLKVQEEKFRNIIANMNLGLVEVDMNDNIIYANQSFCDMSGYDLAELKGNRAAELLMDEENRDLVYNKSKRRAQGINDRYQVEIKRKDGEKRYWFLSGAPNYNDQGKQIGTIGVHLDVTEQKKLELELARAKNFAEAGAKAKEIFLANMSHEIRTPLNVIIGMIRELTKEDLTTTQHFYVNQSEISASHLLTILNNVLDTAKIASGDMEIDQKPFSPGSLAYNAHSIMYSQAKNKGLDLKIYVNPEIAAVLEGDEIRLRQVLINLLGNAIKFTNTGSVKLSVDCTETTDHYQKVLFQVIDTGVGMSEEFVSKVFDKFSQEQDSSNRKYEGTGLGMSISNDLVKLMGGKITASSKKGKGTTCQFTLQLPIGKFDSLDSMDTEIKADSFAGRKALLVEDFEMNRFIAMQSLDFLGFKTTEAEDGKVAIEKVKSDSFDIILMDIQMPVMDGVEATEYIRDRLNIDTPIIALTANAFKQDIELYINKGMNDFVTKPYDEQEFFRKIDHTLHLHKSEKMNKIIDLSSRDE